MVRSSLSAEEQRYWSRVLKLGFVATVAASTGMVAVHGGATATEVVLATLSGAVVGTLLAWYLASIGFGRRDRRDRRD